MKNITEWVKELGINDSKNIIYNACPSTLIEYSIKNNESKLSDNGALVCNTNLTGRSPKDRFIVKTANVENIIYWGPNNIKFEESDFDIIYKRLKQSLQNKTIFIRDCHACSYSKYKVNLRIINTLGWHNLFAYNMFLPNEQENVVPDLTVISCPEFEADPEIHKTNSKNFVIINLKKKIVIIGGTSYAGELKKSIFYFLNYFLPTQYNILPMHCSANVDNTGNTSLFFGLSGTGKTTLSSVYNKKLIGDDEHGWAKEGIFNFENGCYAKVINLSYKSEPQIFDAIKFGAILENVNFYKDTKTVNYYDNEFTENTRSSYPLYHIKNRVKKSISNIPKNIFFLTCDAYGVLPPISKLTINQTMYHFMSGYTSKIAGTEYNINEPEATFSACFGAAFLPLHPNKYASMLGRILNEETIDVWLVNTGWVGGPYGIGRRMSLQDTRTIIEAVSSGELVNSEFDSNNIFNLKIPRSIRNIDTKILFPQNLWKCKKEYNKKANFLIKQFENNFKKYENSVTQEILSGMPGK